MSGGAGRHTEGPINRRAGYTSYKITPAKPHLRHTWCKNHVDEWIYFLKYCIRAAWWIIQKEPTSFWGNNAPCKWADNAELSVPDQMTNITEETRPQSHLKPRPNTLDQFNALSFTACIRACGIAQCCLSFKHPANLTVKTEQRRFFFLSQPE